MDNKLFIGSISWNVTDEQLRDLFAAYGEVTEAIIIKDKFSGRSKGFGFVTFASEEDAAKAVEGLNETELDGRKIFVSVARPKNDER